MKRKKWQRILAVNMVVFGVVMGVWIYHHFRRTTEKAIAEINEECFELSMNLKERTVDVDGENVKLTDLLALSDDELNEMVDNDSFEEFLEENLVGDIESENGIISVKNPYSTNKIAVRTEDETIFDEEEEIVSVEHIANDIYIVEYDNARHTKQGYEEFVDDDAVSLALKDEKVYATDAEVSGQSVQLSYGVKNTGMGNYITKLEYEEKDTEVKVAVLDTGVNTSHEVFQVNGVADRIDFTGAFNYLYGIDDTNDDHGHGTAVAGVIAESTPDNVKIIPVKVLNSRKMGDLYTIFAAAKEVSQYADILNLSLGIDPDQMSDELKTMTEEVFKEISDGGTIVICAAGNSGGPVCYPAACESTLTASAVDYSNKIADFSNYGEEVDFALPGAALQLPDYTENSSYKFMSGTSFASPFLAAAVADVKIDYGYTELSDIIEVLKENAVDLGEEGKDVYYGWGSLNFDSSMFAAPVIASLKVLDQEWAAQNQIQLRAVSGSEMTNYIYTTTENPPSIYGWRRIDGCLLGI